MSWFYRNKKILLPVIAVLLIAGGIFIFGISKSHAQSDGGVRIPVIFHIIDSILLLIMWLASKLVGLGATFAEWVLSIKDFTKVGVVNAGWQITRGLANMFFALILLIMSISTILQSERFGIKKLLPKLVIAALLINFSLLFAGIIIDFAQVITDYFITAVSGDKSLSVQLMDALQIHQIYNFDKDASWWEKIKTVALGPSSTMIMEKIMGIIILLITAFTLLAFAIFLIIRVVVLWLLLIFAPLAWVSMIVAGGGGSAGSIWGQWWSNFFKWTFFAPIYSFFLYLALLVVQHDSFRSELTAPKINAQGEFFQSTFFNDPRILLQYIAVIIILLGGLMAAQQMGIAGAGAVMKLGKSAVKGISKATGRAGSRWLAQGAKIPGMERLGKVVDKIPILKKAMPTMRKAGAVKQRLASMTSPEVWKRAWVARRARADNRAFSQASGALQDLLTAKGFKQVLKGKAPKPFYEKIERNKIVAGRTDEINKGMQDEGERVSAFLDAKDPIEKEALIRSLGSTNSINVIFGETFKREMDAMPELKMKMAKTAAIETEQEELEKRFADQPKTPGYFLRKNELAVAKANVATPQETAAMNAIQQRNEISPENFQGLIGKEFGKEGDRIGNDVQAMMTSNGNFSFTGAYMWDPEKNKIRASSTEERLAAAVGKFKEWEPQDFWRKAHPDSLFKSQFYINHQGKVDMRVTDLNDNGKVYVQNMSGLHYNQVNRAQGRMISKILDNQQVMQQTLTGPVKDKFNQLAEEAKKAHNKRTKE